MKNSNDRLSDKKTPKIGVDETFKKNSTDEPVKTVSNNVHKKIREEPNFTAIINSDKAILDEEGKWETIEEQLLANYAHVIVLRGAGSKNGINLEDADKLLNEQLIPQIEAYKNEGGVAILFDGDQDSPDNPDIGFIMGQLREKCGEESTKNILFVTAQKRSWYYPDNENGHLGNAQGQKYLTYVFEDDTHEGDHNNFTQSEKIVNSEGFETWFVGSFGEIAKEQMADIDLKVIDRSKPAKVLLFPARVKDNSTKRPYGEFYDENGFNSINRYETIYPNLNIKTLASPILKNLEKPPRQLTSKTRIGFGLKNTLALSENYKPISFQVEGYIIKAFYYHKYAKKGLEISIELKNEKKRDKFIAKLEQDYGFVRN